MAFTIKSLHEMDYDLCYAVIGHGGAELPVILRAGHEQASSLSLEFSATVHFRSVIRFEIEREQNEGESGFFPTDDPAVSVIDGTVQSHLEIDPEYVLIDVCIQNGPELVTFCSEDLLNTIPPVGARLKAWVLGLSISPTFT
ncbi:hypothetical protein [Prosthecobacter vanneervenii]|uniref:Uncharacterized protein n=1 Tax=Prosthecobacter vanneervenii TaxID=48466 RepID=A0A7W7YDL0_9BACT|nr:hypothetical protein [Prosthecobacter vanneervenii]MBB5034246.1 hypothetical protein [Prosthecobacter vanneervenii]